MWNGFAVKHFCVQVSAKDCVFITPVWKSKLTEEERSLVKLFLHGGRCCSGKMVLLRRET